MQDGIEVPKTCRYKVCFNFTVFSFKNTLYRQVFGAPMGSCISPVVANIFMAYVEKTAINTFHYRQVFGAPMGFCISPEVANIFMAYVEKTAINTFHYRQVFGAPMGFCISPEVANIFMAYVEKTAINTFHTLPTLWVVLLTTHFVSSNALVSESFMII